MCELIKERHAIRACKPGAESMEYLLENGVKVRYNASERLWRALDGRRCIAVELGGELAGFSFRQSISSVDRQICRESSIGRAYLEYNRVIGGKPFGFTIGMPLVELERYGGLEGMYRECINRGIAWEELLQWSGHSDELPREEGLNVPRE